MAVKSLEAVKIDVKLSKGSFTTTVLKGKTDENYLNFANAAGALYQEPIEDVKRVDIERLTFN